MKGEEVGPFGGDNVIYTKMITKRLKRKGINIASKSSLETVDMVQNLLDSEDSDSDRSEQEKSLDEEYEPAVKKKVPSKSEDSARLRKAIH